MGVFVVFITGLIRKGKVGGEGKKSRCVSNCVSNGGG